jgi:hypothetical protein
MIYPDELMIYKKQGKNVLVKVQQTKLQDDFLTYDVQFPMVPLNRQRGSFCINLSNQKLPIFR